MTNQLTITIKQLRKTFLLIKIHLTGCVHQNGELAHDGPTLRY